MAIAHTITCAGEDCEEYSIRADFLAADHEEAARNHRREVAGEGWSDVEGRDYCPSHKGA